MTPTRRARRAGFTLIELVVVVIIIGILSGIGLNQFRDAEDRARNTGMMTLTRGCQIGMENWRTDYVGIPAEMVGPTPNLALAANSRAAASNWNVRYTPGGMLPITPWARTPQFAVDPSQCSNANHPPDIDRLLADSLTIDTFMAGGMGSDGGPDDGLIPDAGSGPDDRSKYGYLYYCGESRSSKYVIVGIGKWKHSPVVVMVKGNI